MRPAILLFLILCCGQYAFGQKYITEDTPWNFKDRAYGGFGLGGLALGTDKNAGRFFSIGVSVLGGYMLTKNLSSGVGFEYQYTTYTDQKFKQHLYGGYPFVRYNIKNFFIQTDYSIYSVPSFNNNDRKNFDRFFIGAGFSSPGRRRGYTNFLISYDALHSSSSPWGSPLNTRFFFTF